MSQQPPPPVGRRAAPGAGNPGPSAILLAHPSRDVYQVIRLLVKVAGSALIVIFSWLELKGAAYEPLQRIPGDSLIKLALALYYAGWVAGILTDTSVQEQTYSTPPNKGRMPLSGWVSALSLSVGFGVPCFVTARSPGRFVLFLALFLGINVLTWRYLVGKVLPSTVAGSYRDFAGDLLRVEKVRLVYEGYLCGRWQWMRYSAGALGVVVIGAMVVSKQDSLVIGSSILGYVVLMESWVWLVRLRLGASLRLLDYLRGTYSLVPLPGSGPPPSTTP